METLHRWVSWNNGRSRKKWRDEWWQKRNKKVWDLGEEQGSRKEEKDLLEDRDQERSKEENGNQRVSEAGNKKGEEDLAHHSKYSLTWSSFLS